MRRSPKLRPTVWDGLAAVCVIVLAALSAAVIWGGGGTTGGALTAVVSVDGAQRDRVVLAESGGESRTYGNNGYTLQVVMTEEAVWVERADCPTQDCVHTGRISRRGQSIVCLPARVVVTLEGGEDGGVDAVVG